MQSGILQDQKFTSYELFDIFILSDFFSISFGFFEKVKVQFLYQVLKVLHSKWSAFQALSNGENAHQNLYWFRYDMASEMTSFSGRKGYLTHICDTQALSNGEIHMSIAYT